MLLNLLLVLFICYNVDSSSIFEWLGWSDNKGPNLTYKGVPLIEVPFEELSPEDKFLVEASKIVGFELTELDACQHRLVMKLKSSCGSLSEEQLAKFSVNLLNCQAAVEGRQEFPCEEKMSLKDCTADMSAETWNAYHIMNNRARAVCYASRQQQFRALAEITVNKLMSTTHVHIEALTSLQRESANLKGGTKLTLSEIQKSQQDVLTKQRSLARISSIISDEIQKSFQDVTNQKQMLTAFKKDLLDLMTKLENKFDDAEKQISDNSNLVKTSHNNLIDDIKHLSIMADSILLSIDSSSKKVLENNDIALEKFKEALDNMKEINLSIGYILSVVETIKQRSSLISDIVGEKGENIELYVLLVVHSICLMTAMIICTFLSAPWTTRFILLSSSLLNSYLTYYNLNRSTVNYPNLSITEFYLAFIFVAVCDWLIRLIIQCLTNRNTSKLNNSDSNKEDIVTTNYKENTTSYKDNIGLRHADSLLPRTPHINNLSSSDTPVRNKVNNWLSDNRYSPDRRYKSSNINGFTRDHVDDDMDSHVSSAARSICTALSKTGLRCKKKANRSSSFCTIHER